MKKTIKIGREEYSINYSQEVADEILNKVIEWMGKYSAAHSGEGIFQDDDCQIYAPELIADIVDDILQPQSLEQEDEDIF